MTRPLKVAVIGAGRWGEQHARIFSSRSDTELCAIVGRTAAKVDERAASYATTGYTSIAEMVAAAEPDLVTVCLPNEQHFEATLEVLRLGLPVLAEKPLVFDLGEADILLAEAARQDTFFAINFNHRFAEPVQRARRELRSGSLGDIVFATWRFGGEVIPGGGVLPPGGSPHANLIETQCHGFDMLEHLCGPISSVMAQMAKTTHDAYTTLAVALEFAGGGVGTMLGTYDSSYDYSDSQLIEINGTLGRAVIHDTVRSLTISKAGDEEERQWRAGYFNDEARNFHGTFDRHVDAVIDALRSGAEPPVHARAGRRALELAQASIRSFTEGVRVEVPPPTP
ncbi:MULTISPECIES: Gfo/Idh/MocA family protein [Microbacterium]|uniref:Gfo/Idh/MocA family protein n=1 Tax=Microbacterium TaxID=33882 RepID=UPI00344408C8